MGLFGLGSFGEGFVKGFATEANEALKRDIERINTRVEKVADFRVKRAVEEQEERKKDLEDIEDALREAEGLFGADDPRASAYAASLLKQEGSTSALRSFVSQIKSSPQYKSGTTNFANFMEQMEEDAPTGTRSDYARAFLGAPKAVSDYRLPEDAVTAGAGNLLSAIGLKPDISGQVSQQVSEQMAAMGVDIDKTMPTFQLPSIKFMREDFTVSNMSPAERVTYYTTEMNKPENADKVDYYKKKRDEQLTVVSGLGGLQDQYDANVQMYNNETDPEKRSELAKTITTLRDTIDLGEAEMLGDKTKEIDVRIRQAQRAGNVDLVRELTRKKSELTGEVEQLPATITRLTNELGTSLQNGTIEAGSQADTDARAEIARLQKIQDSLPENVSISTSSLNSAASFIDDEVNLAVSQRPEISGEDYLLAVQMVKEGQSLPESLRSVFEKGQALKNNMRNGVYSRIREMYPDNKEINSVLDLRSANLTSDSITIDIGTQNEDSDSVAGGIDAAVEAGTTANSSKVITKDELFLAFPKTDQGIDAIVKSVLTPSGDMKSGKPSDVYEAAMELHGDEQFAVIAEYVAKNQGGGVDKLDVQIAKMALDGKNFNEIVRELKTVTYKNDPSFDIQSLSATVARVLSEIKPENRAKAAANLEKARDYEKRRQEQVLNSGTAIPTGLMSRP